MSPYPHARCSPAPNVSYRPLVDAPLALRQLEEAFAAVERTRHRADSTDPAPRQSRLELSDHEIGVVEPGGAMATVYFASSDELPGPVDDPLAPLCDLGTFWRIWRPPRELLPSRELAVLECVDELRSDPPPPLPARHLASEGWRDARPGDLEPLAERLRETARTLRIEAAA